MIVAGKIAFIIGMIWVIVFIMILMAISLYIVLAPIVNFLIRKGWLPKL